MIALDRFADEGFGHVVPPSSLVNIRVSPKPSDQVTSRWKISTWKNADVPLGQSLTVHNHSKIVDNALADPASLTMRADRDWCLVLLYDNKIDEAVREIVPVAGEPLPYSDVYGKDEDHGPAILFLFDAGQRKRLFDQGMLRVLSFTVDRHWTYKMGSWEGLIPLHVAQHTIALSYVPANERPPRKTQLVR